VAGIDGRGKISLLKRLKETEKMKGIDLFCGAGGTTHGAKAAGINVIYAANHKQSIIDFHALNHPETAHICQDLQQADWSIIPEHDILYGSPACGGHSRAAGKMKKTKKADDSRSTAWAIVDCLEAHKTPLAIIENVPDFLNWELYGAWEFAIKSLGYSLSVNLVNAADYGVPQNRKRLMMVATRTRNPIELMLPKMEHKSARSFIDLDMTGYKWDNVSDRVISTQNRVKNGRARYGEIFLDAAYGSEIGGRSIDKPLGTVTTVNKHSLVIGDKIRALSLREQIAAQSFPESCLWPENKTLTKLMNGNAVPPMLAENFTKAILIAA
jgi:DNA (cytosine-5)-methyltransferase 1